MSARIAAFFLWAAVAASLAFWGLRIGGGGGGLPASVQPVADSGLLRGDINRLFATAAPAVGGVALPTEPALASRFKLVGVMAPREGERGEGQGIALIAIDGKPPRPYRVGAPVDGALVLQSVAKRAATIGPEAGAPAVRLELPPLLPAATGSLPAAASLLSAGVLPAPRLAAPPAPGANADVPPGYEPQRPGDPAEPVQRGPGGVAKSPDNRR